MDCYDNAKRIIKENSGALCRVAEALLEREVLDAHQLALLVKNEPLPPHVEAGQGDESPMETAQEAEQDVEDSAGAGEGPGVLPEPGKQPA